MDEKGLISAIKCPFCGFEKEEKMPTDRCVFFYKCTNCNKIMRPKKGDDCVFCSFSTKDCPTK